MRNKLILSIPIKIFKILFLILFSVILVSCNVYEELELETKNLTEYVFDSNTPQVKTAIKSGLEEYKIPGLALYLKEDDRYDILNIDSNKNDAYLRTFLHYLKSKIYFKDTEPLLYEADFHIHLDSLSEKKTKVTIHTIKSRVITGIKPGIGDNLTFGAANFRKVPPSTIEEYEILLIIGKQLGQQGMPPCKYPDKDAKRITRYNFIL